MFLTITHPVDMKVGPPCHRLAEAGRPPGVIEPHVCDSTEAQAADRHEEEAPVSLWSETPGARPGLALRRLVNKAALPLPS